MISCIFFYSNIPYIRGKFGWKPKIGVFCGRILRSWKVGHKGRSLTVRFNFQDRRWSRKLCDDRQKATGPFQDPIREMSLRVQYLRAFDHNQPVFGPVYRSEFLGPLAKPDKPLSRHVWLYIPNIPVTKRGCFRISFFRIIYSFTQTV